MTHSDTVFWGHLPGSAISTVYSGCVVEIGSEISQDSSETDLAGHNGAGQHGPVSPLGSQLPAPRLDHFQHLALHVCTTLQQSAHTCPGISNTAVPQPSPSPLCSPILPVHPLCKTDKWRSQQMQGYPQVQHPEPPKYCCMPRWTNLAPLLAITRSPCSVFSTGVPKSWNCACHL